jgi:hypothetical protein
MLRLSTEFGPEYKTDYGPVPYRYDVSSFTSNILPTFNIHIVDAM